MESRTEDLSLPRTDRPAETDPHPAAEQADPDGAEAAKESLRGEISASRKSMERLVRSKPSLQKWGYVLAVLILAAAAPVAYFAWWKFVPAVWQWSGEAWWHWLFGYIALMGLAVCPVYPVMFGTRLFGSMAEISLDSEVDGAFDTLQKAERKYLAAEEVPDPAGLLPLVKYSRAQLEVYYKLGLSQTRLSFAFSVIAMWIGFVFIIGGFLIYVGPVEGWFGLARPDQDISVLIIAGGAIIEFVSALFLWVYRSTIGQMTFFYRRQIYAHNVMMCFRIADSMLDADETKKMIVEKFLDLAVIPERPAATGAKGMLGLIKK